MGRSEKTAQSRIKLSGSAFKKLKKQRLESDKKLQKITKWIKKSEDQTEQPAQKSPVFFRCDDEQLLQNNEVNQNVVTTNLLEFKFDDPLTWPKINDSLRCSLVEHGAKQDKREVYPTTSTSSENRHFSSCWFEKNLPNEEKVYRQWLLYSASKSSLFCFPCILFSNTKTSKFADTSKAILVFKNLREGRSLDKCIQNAIQTEKEKWRNILKVVIDSIMFSAKNNLAFRGSSNIIGEPNSGIFLNTIELIARYHHPLAEHIANVKLKQKSVSYLSPQIQNELIELLGRKSEVILYVCVTDGECSIEESFLDFIESYQKTGVGLASEILFSLNKDELNIEDCRGQGYDNRANMSGKYSGVQAQITAQNDLARYVPCAAHTLNLVRVHSAEVSPFMITFFGKVQKIFNFFSSSTNRWDKLMKTLEVTLKSQSETRWSAKKEAIHSLNNQITNVCNVLQEISNDSLLNAETRSGAREILIQVDFKFLCWLDLWNMILTLIDRENRCLQ
ncbi:zinc finger MYM-type protein 1-like [Hydra vulgaris]|uniref:Zinc finger MYM-type protein 1-like n=1 Tax=Hydra vulgaris TaxID=6087 RepID=A0ABM4CLF8_HYDVU